MVGVGLAARFGLSGALADAAGGVFYTALIYVLIAFVRPSARPASVGLAAAAWSWAIELFQLTSVPADLADAFAPVGLVLGSSFVATDLVAYVVGAILAASVDTALGRRAPR